MTVLLMTLPTLRLWKKHTFGPAGKSSTKLDLLKVQKVRKSSHWVLLKLMLAMQRKTARSPATTVASLGIMPMPVRVRRRLKLLTLQLPRFLLLQLPRLKIHRKRRRRRKLVRRGSPSLLKICCPVLLLTLAVHSLLLLLSTLIHTVLLVLNLRSLLLLLVVL